MMLRRVIVSLATFLVLTWTASPIVGASPPDKIVFESDRDGALQIYVMNSDGSNVYPLTHGPGESLSPAFSPDGRKIVFRSNRSGTDQIYIIDADGSHVRRLTNPPLQAGEPTFSPDGRNIAFTGNDNGKL